MLEPIGEMTFKASIDAGMEMVVEWCKRKGWWDDGRTFGDDIALIHSELSEALEAFREHGFADVTPEYYSGSPLNPGGPVRKPEGVGSELADVLVRLLHCCATNNIDLGAEFIRKMKYNETRSYRHGGRAL